VSTIVAGIDEAGLGPILGPLCFGWSAFAVPDPGLDLWEALAGAVAREPARDAERIVVADSKRVFTRNPRGRRRLETTALTSFAATRERDGVPADAGPFFRGPLGPTPECLAAHPWYTALPAALPLWSDAGRLELRAEALRRALRAADVELVSTGVRVVPAGELNRGFARTRNKSTTVGEHLLEVIGHLWRRSDGHDLVLFVDRQGGRAHYGPFLARGLPDARVALVAEDDGRSEYLLSRERGAARIVFAERGETLSLSVALASCLAKYARELAMEAFNGWFAERAPELRPTAGYATDGRRWLADAGDVARAVPAELLVRER
jgi:hypothetical protein